MAKGMGIVEKDPFRVVGLNAEDVKSGGHQYDDETRGRGRPRVDRTWNQVGKPQGEAPGTTG